MADSLSFFEHKALGKSVSIIGIPLDVGKDTSGTDTAPAYLRESGMTRMLASVGIENRDLGDVPCPQREELVIGDKRAKYVDSIATVLQGVAKTVSAEVAAGQCVVALGGDHSIAIGVIKGAVSTAKGTTGVIYIDAHPDANTHESTLSGNVHGMVTTALCGDGHPALTSIGGEHAIIKHENLIFIGVKDFDQAEIDWIREHNINAFTPIDVAAHGLEPIFKAITALAKRVDNVWVSFDIDSIDHQFAPATPMSTAGGLTFREIYAISKCIGKTCAVLGTDIVECMPTGDERHKTAYTAVTFVANLLGTEYSWYTDYMAEEQRKQQERG